MLKTLTFISYIHFTALIWFMPPPNFPYCLKYLKMVEWGIVVALYKRKVYLTIIITKRINLSTIIHAICHNILILGKNIILYYLKYIFFTKFHRKIGWRRMRTGVSCAKEDSWLLFSYSTATFILLWLRNLLQLKQKFEKYYSQKYKTHFWEILFTQI